MNEKVEHILAQIGRFSLYAAALVPGIFATSGFVFPFITPKVFVIQAAALFVLVVTIILILYKPQTYAPKKSWLLLFGGMWLLWLIISAAFGVDFYRSIWSDQERMFGIFTVACFSVLGLGASILLAKREHWSALVWSLLLSGAVVMLGGLYQLFNPMALAGDGVRLESTTGNATYLAFYAVFIFGLAAFYWLRVSAEGLKGKALVRIGLIALMALCVVNFVAAAARGAALGIAVAMVWVAVLGTAYGSSQMIRRSSVGFMLALVVLASALVLGRDTSLVQSVPLLSRVSDFSITGTIETRLRTWDSALKATAEKPLFGWGWSNFAAAYDQHYNPDQLKHGYGETWFDNAHNTLIEVLTTSGVIGAVLYVLMFSTAFVLLFRAHRSGRVKTLQYALLSGYLLFHFVQSLFVFDHPLSFLALYFVMGYIVFLDETQAAVFSKGIKISPSSRKVVTAGVILLGVIVVNMAVIRPARANRLESDSHEALALQHDIGLWHEQTRQALDLRGPYSYHIVLNAGKALQEIPVAALPRTRDLAAIYEDIIGLVQKNVVDHPHYVTHRLLYASLLANQGMLFEESKEASSALAMRAMDEARQYSPLRQQMFYTLIQSYMDAGQFQKAHPHIGMLRSSSILHADVHRVIGGFYLLAGLQKQAIEAYETAIRIKGSPMAVVGPSDNLELLEEYGLLHIEHGNPKRGVWFIDSVVACKSGEIDWLECLPGGAEIAGRYTPSRKALAGALIYYRSSGKDERVGAYGAVAARFYQGVRLQQILNATP